MINSKTVRQLALAFEGVEEQPHFETASFRVNKKIFVTLDEKKKRACLKLSTTDQDIFSLTDKKHIYPVPNKWGMQGWTFVELPGVKKDVFAEALTSAYFNVAPKALSVKYSK
jgi:predicted DNA-binding protein (MmcQ/YjbR family)